MDTIMSTAREVPEESYSETSWRIALVNIYFRRAPYGHALLTGTPGCRVTLSTPLAEEVSWRLLA